MFRAHWDLLGFYPLTTGLDYIRFFSFFYCTLSTPFKHVKDKKVTTISKTWK